MEKFSKISDKITQNIGLIIVIFSVVAYFVPDYFSWMTNYTTIFLALAMFGMGTSIEADAFKKILKNPRDIFIGSLAQFTIMPLIAWILALGFNVNRDIALGVILVGSRPGGTASNVITHIAGGNVSLSVSMTILSTLLAPLVTPFLVYLLAGRWVEVSILAMFKSVVTVVLIPVLMGIFAKKLSPEKMEKSKSIFPLISSLAIILIISGIIGANSEKIAKSGLIVLLIVMIHNALGLLLGLGVSKLFKMDYDKQTALSIEVGMQNSGLAIQLATANFALNPLATLPGAIFSIWHNISGSIFASIRRKDVKEIALAREK
ncbi:bile acid:sodium symporter family protein [Anaerococcus hydrogenalis]|uniref:Sodium transporter n=1 Tax=Anaerococcus hydrogenalis TaxID=33029 RepID=A0A2N6UHX2_9FIRM|nr:bile acid:sodium symporter family protein [Anaerococcus hydrogenalis]MDK7695362.1 bile acid:sodium symporter family protein [Anaerococcus hydrogenalis]MDK7697121.1 bile acid:sodium symporter family protein [Anaerococcus hydrogenalis]MDK7708358.1 bile acid:sodium symporter family protein [Anaerococcus hydrogenalis]PMC81182.1 sodium transporter [Anaerococcus hydrogenalis]